MPVHCMHLTFLPVTCLSRDIFIGRSDPVQSSVLQTILFDDFLIWEGKCEPGQEPAGFDIAPVMPRWSNLKSNLDKPTTLRTSVVFESAFTSGGCGEVHIENVGEQKCDEFLLELNIRPDWGALMEKEGSPALNALELLDSDETTGAAAQLLLQIVGESDRRAAWDMLCVAWSVLAQSA